MAGKATNREKDLAEKRECQPNDPQITAREPAAEWVPVEKLIDWDKNPRKNDEAAPKLAKLMVKLGFGSAMLGWRELPGGPVTILGGHTRKKAVRILQRAHAKATRQQLSRWHSDAIRTAQTGMIPIRVRGDLTREQAHQLAIADNKANEWAEWDNEKLANVLSEFSIPDVDDLGFDPSKIEGLANDIYGLDDESAANGVTLDTSFQVVITVESEEEQLRVIEWAQTEGLKCRALI